jgi:ABC-type cobalamin/Fe3+-siderophores transport system ATPase subunit
MKIKSLTFLSDYKRFKKGQTFSFSSDKKTVANFGNTNFSVLVGRNGSGKTTLMSLIPTLFHHIERYKDKIPADFELIYSIEHFKKTIEVKVSHVSNLIRVSVPNRFDNVQLVPKRNPTSNDFSIINKNEEYIEYSLFHEYTPLAVVTSTFSFHGEYPIARPNNYQGHQIVSNHTITNIYGRNHYEIGSISRGILRFIKLFFESKNEIKELLNLFDLKFTNRVLHKYHGKDPIWLNVNRQWISQKDSEIQNEEAYLNDIEFERYGRTICLSNMSSGEKMLLLRAITILNSIEQNSIVIIEEPELHLDQVWNRQLTTLFKVLFNNFNSHIVIATHDYSIINSVAVDNLILLKEGDFHSIKENTFLASYDELFRILYGDKFRINKIEDDFLKSLSQKNIEELQNDYDELGNSVYKYLVFKQIKKLS